MKPARTYVFENTLVKEAAVPAKTVFSNSVEAEIEPAAVFGGSGHALNPEEMLIAAVNGCLMQTFFYFTEKFKIEIVSYRSHAQGHLEKQTDGFRFTLVEVLATALLPNAMAVEKAQEAVSLAEKYCLVSRSVNCPVSYRLEINVQHK